MKEIFCIIGVKKTDKAEDMSNYTKQALGESLKKLLSEKPLNKITVTEIVNDCGLNRMTFYYHFQDIYDLLEWVCVEDAEKALKGKSSYSNWQDGLYTDALFISVIDELDKDNKLDPDDKEFIASFYKYAFLGIMMNWVDNDMKEDPKELIERLSIVVEGDITNAVERFSERRV